MRTIKSDIWTDPFFAPLPPEFQLLWLGLINTCADDQGRFPDDAEAIKWQIFAANENVTAEIVEMGLRLFARKKKLVRYVAANNGTGRKLVQLNMWHMHQKAARGLRPSRFPPPPPAGSYVWIDRISCPGEGRAENKTQIQNPGWKLAGGWTKRMSNWHNLNTPVVLPPRKHHASVAQALEYQEELKEKTEQEQEKGSLPPTSPQPQRGRNPDGWKDAARTIEKILTAASFRDKRKTVSISEQVAMRILPSDPIPYVIASFASAFGNSKVKDPVAVAVYQLENDQVPKVATDPKLWRNVPPEILAAAGITDLAAYMTERFIRG